MSYKEKLKPFQYAEDMIMLPIRKREANQKIDSDPRLSLETHQKFITVCRKQIKLSRVQRTLQKALCRIYNPETNLIQENTFITVFQSLNGTRIIQCP